MSSARTVVTMGPVSPHTTMVSPSFNTPFTRITSIVVPSASTSASIVIADSPSAVSRESWPDMKIWRPSMVAEEDDEDEAAMR